MYKKKLLLLLIVAAGLVAGCSSAMEPTLSPPTTPEPASGSAALAATPTAPHSPVAVPTLNSSAALVPQLVDHLADRLGIPREEIALQGLRPIVWKRESRRCPSLPDSTAPLEYVMIVTQDGARYEEPAEEFKPGQRTTTLVLLAVDETVYPYYVFEDRFLACPPEE